MIWYTLGTEKLTEEEKYILALVEEDIEKLEELGSEDKVMKEYIKEAEKVSFENKLGESYDKELALKEAFYEEGALSTKKEIAKSMLNKSMNVDLISELTGLSIDEIESIK